MSLVHLLPVPESKTSLVMLLANVILAIGVIRVMIKLIRALGGGALALCAALAAFVLNRGAMYWTTDGLETMLLTFFFTLGMYLVIRDALRDRVAFSTYAVLAVMALVRADAVVLTACAMVVSLAINRRRKRVVACSALALVVPLAHELFRIFYYRDVLPNTAYLKVMNWGSRSAAGVAYVADFVKGYLLILLVAALGALMTKDRIRLSILGLAAVYGVYLASIGGDAFGNLRFFVPIVPLLAIIAFLESLRNAAGARRFPNAFKRIWRSRVEWFVALLCIISSPLIVPGYLRYLVPSQGGSGNVEIGLMLKRTTRPECTVVDFWAGSVFYFSGRYGIDMLGKCDRYIARLPADPQSTTPGHNKFDFDYSLGGRRPHYVIANFKLPVSEDRMRKAATGNGAFTGQLYFNRFFREHYLRYPLQEYSWCSIFARDGGEAPDVLTGRPSGSRAASECSL